MPPISTLPGINMGPIEPHKFYITRTPTELIRWTHSDTTLDHMLETPEIQKLLLSTHKVVYCTQHKHIICFTKEKYCPVTLEFNSGETSAYPYAGFHYCDIVLTWKEKV